jgi:ABC-2 type transport system ATP-binding protein
MADTMIEADGLYKSYGATRALAGVSFSVPAGTVLGLLGPNGAGKTTAVRILTTLARPDAGRAWVAGLDVLAQPAAVRRQIGVAAQDATLDGLLTGRQNLTLVGELSGMRTGQARTRAAELLELFELTDAADRVVKGYSGGMRRRLDLAASLLTQPPVLFLDEPTTGLDPVSRQRVWEVIRKLIGSGVTLLLTTQYLDEADALADRIVVVNHGQVIADGTPLELKERSRSAHVEVTLAEPRPEAAEVIEPLVGGRVSVSADGLRLGAAVDSAPGLATAPGPGAGPGGDARGQHRGPAALAGRRLLRAHRRAGARERRGAGMTTAIAQPRPGEAAWNVVSMTRRNLVHISREPMQLSDATIQPVLFTVLFIYIFGGAIPIPHGGSYKDFILPGMLALNLTTSTMGTAVGLATDLHEGIIDRFRVLPMWRPAVLVGRSLADLLTATLCALVVAVTGLVVGWRTSAAPLAIIGGFALVLFFAYSLSWVAACVGLNSKSPESAASFGFIVLFPLAFVSNALVPTQHMPGWLQAAADWNPVSAVTAGARQLWGNPNPSASISAWPMQHPVEASLAWSVLIVAVAAPLASWYFRRRTTE